MCPTNKTRSYLGDSIGGDASWLRVVSLTNSWKTSTKPIVSDSSAPLLEVFDEMNTARLVGNDYVRGTSVPPLRTYVRAL